VRLDTRRRLYGGGLALALASGAALASGGAAFAAAAPAGATPVTLNGSGSDTTVNLMRSLDSIYAQAPGCPVVQAGAQPQNGACTAAGTATDENPKHDNVNQYFEVGSGNGKAELCNQGQAGVRNVDFARSSSGYGNGDCNDLKFVAYAQDAVPWWHFVGSPSPSANVQQDPPPTTGPDPTNNLGQNQLKGIFAQCTIVSWKQVRGSTVYDPAYRPPSPLPGDFYDPANFGTNVPILVFAAQTGSGTRSTFDGFVGGASDTCIPAANKQGNFNASSNPNSRLIFENDATPILNQSTAAGGGYSVRDLAIFYYSLGRYTQNPASAGGAADPNSKEGAVDAVQANGTTIGNNTFPYTRSLYNVYRYGTPETLNYVKEDTGFLCRPVDATGASGSAMSQATRDKLNAAILAQGFFPFGLGNSGSGGQSFCRLLTRADKLDTTAPTASIAGIPSGQRTATITFSEPVVGVSPASVGLRIGGTAQPTTITCLDLSGTALPCNDPAKGAKTVLLTLTGDPQQGATYTAFANGGTGGIRDRAGNQQSGNASTDFPSPFVAPATVTVTRTETVTVQVPGQNTTIQVPTTAPATIVVGQITGSGKTLRVPVVCVNKTCTGVVTLKLGTGKTVSKKFTVGAGSNSTIVIVGILPKGAKKGKTQATFNVRPDSGQTFFGKRSGGLKI